MWIVGSKHTGSEDEVFLQATTGNIWNASKISSKLDSETWHHSQQEVRSFLIFFFNKPNLLRQEYLVTLILQICNFANKKFLVCIFGSNYKENRNIHERTALLQPQQAVSTTLTHFYLFICCGERVSKH